MNSYTLPAGRYYVGDPCYVFDWNWVEVLSNTDFFRKYPEGEYAEKIWGHDTKWGDGCYYDENWNMYPVDAGLIGVVHEDLCESEGHGKWVTFEKPFDCGWDDENGTIIIGHIRIKTDLDEEDRCWNYDDEEED